MTRSDEQTAKAFGAALRAERTKRGWSQERLAEGAGLHRVYISELERGLRSPTLKAFMRIADALEMKPSVLMRKFEG